MMKVQSYLFFEGRCEEALDFYRDKLGAEITMKMRFSENPEPASSDGCGPGTSGDKIMHAAFKIGETLLMASDGRASGAPEFKGVSLSISVANGAEAQRVFAALGDGGQVQMPLTKTFFASAFGMVADRFGVSWMVIADPET